MDGLFVSALARVSKTDYDMMQAMGPGLAGLIQGMFGKTLDKRLQCSDWGSRPLSVNQVHSGMLH